MNGRTVKLRLTQKVILINYESIGIMKVLNLIYPSTAGYKEQILKVKYL